MVIMKKTNFIIFNLKKYIFAIFSFLFVILLIFYSSSNLEAAKNGLKLWSENVVPTLFPFFVATEILCSTNFINLAGKILRKPVKKIFNVPGEGAIALILGIISGYPVGAKIIVNFREKNICTKEEGERLLAFTNNSGPLFILGTVGASLFKDINIGYILLKSHIISCLIVGFIFRNWKKSKEKSTKSAKIVENNCKIKDNSNILGNSITNSIKTILKIGGFIVIFSVIISILNKSGVFEMIEKNCAKINVPKGVGTAVFSGIIELTNGIKILSSLGNTYFFIEIASFLLGLGGISVLLQVYSVISKSDISIKPYIYGKIMQSLISVFITKLLLTF